MNAIDDVERYHQDLKEKLSWLERSESCPERVARFNRMRAVFVARQVVEEELLYPALADTDVEPRLVAGAYDENVGTRAALERCARAVYEDGLFRVRVTTLLTLFVHHTDGIRDSMFQAARDELEPLALASLGLKMHQRFTKALEIPDAAARLNQMSTHRTKQALAASVRPSQSQTG